jgi:hypothetical protein
VVVRNASTYAALASSVVWNCGARRIVAHKTLKFLRLQSYYQTREQTMIILQAENPLIYKPHKTENQMVISLNGVRRGKMIMNTKGMVQ